MDVEDYLDTKTGVVAAATAASVSPRARELFRRGAVYGLAGMMKAGDVAVAAARGAVRGAKDAATEGQTQAKRSRSRQAQARQSRPRPRGRTRS